MCKKVIAAVIAVCLFVELDTLPKAGRTDSGSFHDEWNMETENRIAPPANTPAVSVPAVAPATATPMPTVPPLPDVVLKSTGNLYRLFFYERATEHLPELKFELTGTYDVEEHNYDNLLTYYYPVKLAISTSSQAIQTIDFLEDGLGTTPCTLNTVGFKYGDYRFDGCGGFRILSSSMGQNPSYYFWTWDSTKGIFVEDRELEHHVGVGYSSFDYDKKWIMYSNYGGGNYHEQETYQYYRK